MKSRSLALCVAVVLLSCLHLPALASEGARLWLPSIFADHAVLQQGLPLPVWGRAEAGAKVTVAFAGQTKAAVADANGGWRIRLDALQADAAGRELTVAAEHQGRTERIVRRDVLVGEVWVGSGQSNMWWSVAKSRNAGQEIARADCPQIRLFTCPMTMAHRPRRDVRAAWEPCRPENVADFSAVAYFFGRQLHKALNVPVGLIHSSWPGSAIQSWIPRAALEPLPSREGTYAAAYRKLDELAAAFDRDRPRLEAEHRQAVRRYEAARAAFLKNLDANDAGVRDGWRKPGLDMTDWRPIEVPGDWEHAGLGKLDGVVWFRREVNVPAAWAGKDLTLELGPIDDVDVTYFNGQKVGAIGYETPDHWMLPRRYTVPGRLVKGGANTIAIRVTDIAGEGGFVGWAGQMKLRPAGGDAKDAVSLAGTWRCKVSRVIQRGEVPRPPPEPREPAGPSGMYNAMIAPVMPYAIAGALWYQGESNAGDGLGYETLLTALIRSWRQGWGCGDFCFLVVQLANLSAPPAEPSDGGWAWIRQAQAATARAVPKAGLGVAIDIGEENDVHPRNKQELGRRLALAALAIRYGRKVEWSGPVYESMAAEGDPSTLPRVRLRFSHVGGGLVARGRDDGMLSQFAIAGADRRFVWAKAKIDPDKPGTVLVWSESVLKPAAVRYAWAMNPHPDRPRPADVPPARWVPQPAPNACNLYNAAGLPAVPFRTDDWPKTPPPRKK